MVVRKKIIFISILISAIVLITIILNYNNYSDSTIEAKKMLSNLSSGNYTNEIVADSLIAKLSANGNLTDKERKEMHHFLKLEFEAKCSNTTIPSDSCSPRFLAQFIANNYMTDFGYYYDLNIINNLTNYSFSSIERSTVSDMISKWNEYYMNKENFSQYDIPDVKEIARAKHFLGEFYRTLPEMFEGNQLFWALKLSKIPTNEVETKYSQVYFYLKLALNETKTTIDGIDNIPGIDKEEAHKNICGNIPSAGSLNDSPLLLYEYYYTIEFCKVPVSNEFISKVQESVKRDYTDLDEQAMKILLIQNVLNNVYKN